MENKAKCGQPLKFKKGQLTELFNQYKEKCLTKNDDGKDTPMSISGFAAFAGTNRMTLLNYKGRKEFEKEINYIKSQCEADSVDRMLSGRSNPISQIFNLKNNYGWKDKSELDTNVSGDVGVTIKYVVDNSIKNTSFNGDSNDNSPMEPEAPDEPETLPDTSMAPQGKEDDNSTL